MNGRRIFCPGVLVESATAEPPGVIGLLASGGTSYRFTVAEPVYVLCGSSRIVYVPAAGSVRVSRKPPKMPTYALLPSVLPSGLRIETKELGMLTDESFTLNCSPARPSKRSRGFWPGALAVTISAGPFAVIVPTCAATPLTERVVERAPVVAVSANVSAPAALGV